MAERSERDPGDPAPPMVSSRAEVNRMVLKSDATAADAVGVGSRWYFAMISESPPKSA